VVSLDIYRITQGLERDFTGEVDYDLIAGKDTLVRVRLYSVGNTGDVTKAACRVALAGVALIPETVPASFTAPGINPSQTGSFRNSSTIDCWWPGSLLQQTGVYVFSIEVETANVPTQIISLGSRTFQHTGDLRLYVLQTLPAQGDPNYPTWIQTNSEFLASIRDLLTLQRMFPLRAGWAPLDLDGATPHSAGLRVLFGIPFACPSPYDPNNPCDAVHDALARNQLKANVADTNAALAQADSQDGKHRDRVDLGLVLNPQPSIGGGQAQGSPGTYSCTAGSGLDNSPDSVNGSVVSQELAHCLGQVDNNSPHSQAGNTIHSATTIILIDQVHYLPMVNMLTHQDVDQPHSMMYWCFCGGGWQDSLMMLEGWEWNLLRKFIESRLYIQPLVRKVETPVEKGVKGRAVSTIPPSVPLPQPQGPLFELAGLIDPSDTVSVTYSKRIDGQNLPLTPLNDASPYALVFLDASSNQLARFPFEVFFQGTHGDFKIVPIFLVTPLPSGSARVEIRKADQSLYGLTFPATPPSVTNVIATPGPSGTIQLSWAASSAGGATTLTPLRYRVSFVWSQAVPPQIVADGLAQASYTFSTSFAPATSEGKLIVEASDGYNTASAASNPFTIASQPPLVTIVNPTDGSNFMAGQLIHLVGAAYDYTNGLLADNASLWWSSDRDGPLGNGEELTVPLSVGRHTVTLLAKAPLGLSASTSIVVTVEGAPTPPAQPVTVNVVSICEGCAAEPIQFAGALVTVSSPPLGNRTTPFSFEATLGASINLTAFPLASVSSSTLKFSRWRSLTDNSDLTTSATLTGTVNKAETLAAVYQPAGGSTSVTLTVEARNVDNVLLKIPIQVLSPSKSTLTTTFQLPFSAGTLVTLRAPKFTNGSDQCTAIVACPQFLRWRIGTQTITTNQQVTITVNQNLTLVAEYQ
jgi:hypothetical protein